MINCAFLVGCVEYKAQELCNLMSVKDDIINMKDALIKYCDCPEDSIYIIADTDNAISRPTGYDLCKAIEDIAIKYCQTSIENMYFYYSGHGFISPVKKEALLVPTDTYLNSIVHGTISLSNIIDLIKESFTVKHIIFILDMCLNINPFAKGTARANDQINSDYSSESAIVYYSCYPRKSSYTISPDKELELGRGSVFTHVFIDALNDINCFTAKEIEDFCTGRVGYYNSITANFQKPYTKYLGPGLEDVQIKLKHPLLPDGATLDDFKEYQKANTVNAQLDTDEIGLVIKEAKRLSEAEDNKIALWGENRLNTINHFINSNQEYSKTAISLYRFKEAEDTLNIIYNNVEAPQRIHIALDEHTLLNKSIEEIENEIFNNFVFLYSKTVNMAKFMQKKAKDYMRELFMFIIAGTIVINKNQESETSLLQKKVDTFRQYCLLLNKLLDEIDEVIKSRSLIIQDLNEYARQITAICENLYKDKKAIYYNTRYNNKNLANLLNLLNSIENYIISDALTVQSQ